MNSKTKVLTSALCSLLLAVTAACASRPATEGGTVNGNNAAPAAATSSGSTGGGSGATAISASDQPLDVMTKAMRAQLDAKSFRARVTSSAANGPANKMVIEYVAPDRYRMVSEGQSGGENKVPGQEFIIVGKTTYIKGPNGQWAKAPFDMGEMVKAFRDPKVLDELAKTADVKYVGAETLDGVPMLIYEYTQNNPMGLNLKSQAKTWLSVADGLPRKTETEGVFNGVKTKTLMTLSDYNSDIKIESPLK